MKGSKIIALAVIVLGVGSCNTTGCLDNQSAVPLAGFYDSSTGSSIRLSGLRISGVDAPNDSVLLDSAQSVSELYLPMRSTKESTAWCIRYMQEGLDYPWMNDTIEFDYLSKPYFASEECGAMYYYNIRKLRYTTHIVDSVVITDSLITNVDIQRIRIYFRTSTQEEEEE